MIASATMKWVKKTKTDGVSIENRWLVLQNGVNDGTIYKGRPVGNSPEFMPLDNSLNAYVNHSYNYHCVMTSHLHKMDPRNFSLQT